EYRANYKAGKENALFAHDLLNQYTDDDTGMLLGDLLLNETKEELGDKYDALSEDEKKQHADLVTIRMQANVAMLDAIVQYLAIGINSSKSNSDWIKEIEVADYDALFEEYQALDPLASAPSIESRMIVDFDADAKYLAAEIQGLKTYLSYYTDSGITLDASDEEIQQYFDTHDNGDAIVWGNAGALYTTLETIDYNGTPLLDFIFNEEYDFVHNIDDRIELYPLLDTMSPAQVAALAEISFSSLLSNSFLSQENWKTKHEETTFPETAASVYFGVDRSLFEKGGIGLTGSANSLQNGSNKTFDEGSFGYGMDYTEMIIGGTALITCSVGLYIAIANHDYSQHLRELTEIASQAQSKSSSYASALLTKFDMQARSGGTNDFNAFIQTPEGKEIKEATDKMVKASDDADEEVKKYIQENGVRISDYVGLAVCIISLIVVAWAVWDMVTDMIDYYNRELTPIPSMMVHTYQDEADGQQFCYYYAATCNRNEVGMEYDTLNVNGDLNGDVGKEWLALYYTKDPHVGKPILADNFTAGSNMQSPAGTMALSLFNNAASLNLVDEAYVFSGSADPIYLYFKTDNMPYTGSTFSGGTLAIFSVLSALLGAGICALVMKGRRKKEQPAV
ncbi:MAG: hypothetical protein IKP69_07070, partial [Oscillospiraceae bacterium]|nr:hypothetical protein [Oscillospiraceae bacterium]